MVSRLHAHVGTLRQLEILLAVADSGSISGAARQLHLTQPTVSMQLKKLADAIGMPIFEQLGRRRIFTDAGHALAETAREVLGDFERLEMTLSELRGLKAGTLRIAVVNTSQYFIPHLLGPFCARYPAIEVQFKVGNRKQTIERLQEGKDEIYVFSHPPEDEDIEAIDFLPNPLVAIAPQSHALATRKHIKLEAFAKEPFLIREPGSGTRHAIEQRVKKMGIHLNIKMTIESNEAIKHAVMSGLGVSILSAHSLAFGGREGLVELPVTHLPIDSHWYLVRRKDQRLSPIAKTFMEYLNTEGRDSLLKELDI